MSLKPREGIMSDPADDMWSISVRREERRRDQDAVISGSWRWMREDLMSANRVGNGTASLPEREAKTEEISPSARRAREIWGCVAVARVRWRMGRLVLRGIWRSVESILSMS